LQAVSTLFLRLGPDLPQTPVIVSVPHAGRYYPPLMTSLARQSVAQLRTLEDRFADRLGEAAALAGHQVLLAQVARGWIDLNRDERELDAAMVVGPVPGTVLTAKVRGGLGLIPRRTAAGGDIWRNALLAEDVARRISHYHRPYHDTLAAMLTAAHARFGIAVLLDLHSMPPPANRRDAASPHLVVGDLFGRASDARFSWRLIDEARDAGFRTALNSPYAGGFILGRHANPGRGHHGLQLEIGRQLYLDSQLDQCGPGLRAIERLVIRLANALADEALTNPLAAAAE
jgi:N-formylglutamate amidohydrolase